MSGHDLPDGAPDAVRLPDSRMIRHQVVTPARAPGSPPPAAPPRRETDDAAATAGVRPFIVTGGRTAPVDERLRIESQVLTTPLGREAVLDFEHRRIVELCDTSLSVAEIGAALALPLGVVRVLVADLAAVGAVIVRQPAGQISRAAVERMLERVHAL